MKKVLSLLLVIVFLDVQAKALVGGPDFGGGGGSTAFALGGTYAGVLIPNTETNPTTSTGSAAIGLFSVGVPATGPATGAAVVFVDGTAYNGNINAVADPDQSTLKGIVEAIGNFDIINVVQTSTDAAGKPVFTTVTTNIFAQGNIDTTIFQGFAPVSLNGVQTSTGVRIEGTASIDLFSEIDPVTATPIVANTVTFQVDGFLQSATVATSSFTITLPTNSNNNNNNNNGS